MTEPTTTITVGVISDTHGLLRPQAVEVLRGSTLIIHAGDVGRPDVLQRLRSIAPTVAVRGNVDDEPWANALSPTLTVKAGGRQLYVLHELSKLDLDPRAGGFAAVISGHTHVARADVREDVLYLNPGSAGPRRFNLPVTVAVLRVHDQYLSHEIVTLAV